MMMSLPVIRVLMEIANTRIPVMTVMVTVPLAKIVLVSVADQRKLMNVVFAVVMVLLMVHVTVMVM